MALAFGAALTLESWIFYLTGFTVFIDKARRHKITSTTTSSSCTSYGCSLEVPSYADWLLLPSALVWLPLSLPSTTCPLPLQEYNSSDSYRQSCIYYQTAVAIELVVLSTRTKARAITLDHWTP